MSFKDENFGKRFSKMGDLAEGVFERVYPEGWVRYGINRPPINLVKVPAFVRYTPDYLTGKGLVEVQGFGQDQTLKLKADKLRALIEWRVACSDTEFPVHLFVFDSANNEYAWVALGSLQRAMDTATQAFFPEGKLYYAWHKHQIPTDDGWHDAGA